MIKSSMRVENPEDVEFTLSLTMSLQNWKRLRDHLAGEGWPMWEVGSRITGVVNLIEKRWEVAQQETEEAEAAE